METKQQFIRVIGRYSKEGIGFPCKAKINGEEVFNFPSERAAEIRRSELAELYPEIFYSVESQDTELSARDQDSLYLDAIEEHFGADSQEYLAEQLEQEQK